MPKYEGQTIPTVGQALPRTGFGSRSTPKSEALPPQRLCLLPYHIRTELGFMKTKGFTGALAFSQHSKNALRGLTHLQRKKNVYFCGTGYFNRDLISTGHHRQSVLLVTVPRKSLFITLHEGFTIIILFDFFLLLFNHFWAEKITPFETHPSSQISLSNTTLMMARCWGGATLCGLIRCREPLNRLTTSRVNKLTRASKQPLGGNCLSLSTGGDPHQLLGH